MRVKFVIWDFDNTLVDSDTRIFTALSKMYGSAINEKLSRTIKESFPLSLKQLHELISKSGISQHSYSDFWEIYKSNEAPIAKPFSWVTQQLIELHKRGAKSYIFTSAEPKYVRDSLAAIEVSKYINCIKSCQSKYDDVLSLKSFVDGIGAIPEQTVYVGDSSKDKKLAMYAKTTFLEVRNINDLDRI